MSQPTLEILTITRRLMEAKHSWYETTRIVLRYARNIGYSAAQAKMIVMSVYADDQWSTWG